MLYVLGADAMQRAPILLRAKHALERYFSVMPAPVADGSEKVKQATEQNLRASEANAEAGLKLIEELNTLGGLMREERKR